MNGKLNCDVIEQVAAELQDRTGSKVDAYEVDMSIPNQVIGYNTYPDSSLTLNPSIPSADPVSWLNFKTVLSYCASQRLIQR
jgi:hypothetical protein